MAKKVFKSLEEQVQILKDKGLLITDEDKAKKILFRENYFFLSGYRHLFLEKNGTRKFKKGARFEELYALFQFDRQFRNIIFKNVLIIENNYKSITSYILSKKYGYKEKDYLKTSNFTKDRSKSRQVNDLLKKMKRQIRINGAQHTATTHYYSQYGYAPLWIVVKVLSFGIMSELFSILKDEEQQDIANVYHLDVETLDIYFPILANYRNLCAHEDILYDHFTQRVIPDNAIHSYLNIEKTNGEYIYGKNDIFALIIILKQMLTKDEFKLMMNEIIYELDRLSGKLSSISIDSVLNEMGFPLNYKEIMYYE